MNGETMQNHVGNPLCDGLNEPNESFRMNPVPDPYQELLHSPFGWSEGMR